MQSCSNLGYTQLEPGEATHIPPPSLSGQAGSQAAMVGWPAVLLWLHQFSLIFIKQSQVCRWAAGFCRTHWLITYTDTANVYSQNMNWKVTLVNRQHRVLSWVFLINNTTDSIEEMQVLLSNWEKIVNRLVNSEEKSGVDHRTLIDLLCPLTLTLKLIMSSN